MTVVPNEHQAIVDDQWYIEHVPPWPGSHEHGCIVVSHTMGRGHWSDEIARTPSDALALIRRHAADQTVLGVFVTQGRMRVNDRKKRAAEIADVFGGIWLDLDAKDFGYPDQDLAAKFTLIIGELKVYLATVGLPFPSAIVWSGGGAHVYWLFDQPVSKEQWEAPARALRNSAEQYGLPADLQCTTDAARVLRVPGTENRKPEYGEPLLAEVIHPATKTAPVRYRPSELGATLAKYVSAPQPPTPHRGSNVVPFPQLPPRPPLTGPNELGAGIELNLDEIRSALTFIPARDITSEKGWVRLARALAHTAFVYPRRDAELWTILDEVSRRASNYDAEDNRARWNRYIREAPKKDRPITIATVFAWAKSAGWPGLVSPAITSLGNSAQLQQSSNVAEFVPGNEQQCRTLIDRVVADDPNTYTLGDLLVILRIPEKNTLPRDTQWEADFPGTTPASQADIMERAERLQWMQRAGGKSDVRLVRTHPPRAFVGDYLAQMRGRYAARPIRAVVRVPSIDRHADIRFISGYDSSTGLFHDKTPIFDVPDNPTLDDAREAVRQLLLPFAEYTFEDRSAGQALVLAAIFTAIERPFLPIAPMFVVRSPMPGTGKGLCVRSIVHLAFGTIPVLITWGGSGEEFEKRLAAILLRAPAALMIDNANGMHIQGDLIESTITEGRADIRPLGRSEVVSVHNSSFVTLTGNNPIITGDMARRAVAIDILPRSGDPERDQYSINPVDYVRAHRIDLLRHAFTAMKAFRLAGMPSHGLPAVGSFDQWSRRVRDLVFWVAGYDVSEVFRRNKAEDPRRQADAALIAALHGHFGSKPFKSADAVSIYQRIKYQRRLSIPASAATSAEQALVDAIDDVLGSRDVNPKLFGYWARRVKHARLSGFVLDTQHDAATNANVLVVRRP